MGRTTKVRRQAMGGMKWIGAACIAAIIGSGALAQSLFAPAIQINDRVITYYEIEQRREFLRLLRAPGNLDEVVVEQLIDDRLRLDAAAEFGVSLNDEQVEAAETEFASRANLSREEFIGVLEAAGVHPSTYRDFVVAGSVWREVVRGRFNARAQISEAEVDRALALSSQTGGARVLLSEIILPADAERRFEAELLAEDLSDIRSFDRFAAAAREYSASASRGRGGRMDWMPLSNLPPQIRGEILTLAPGETTGPIRLDNAIAIFQLRALEETDVPQPTNVAVEYARFFVAADTLDAARARAEALRAEVDVCDDLYGAALGLPEEQLERVVLPLAEVPADTALELAKLDAGEVSTALVTTDGRAAVFLMLCGRTPILETDIDREQVAGQLRNARLASYAEGYLAELKADAFIRFDDESLRPGQ